ncbi:MAG: methyltransferase [Flavobacteriales bacterium]|nr:methyltransferase [Flavobacteriales bacterium]|tara:strand:+ start:176 stop:814 length:639 start_codon:yes stop_codon:yes gene_type:complete
MNIINNEIEEYVNSHTQKETKILKEINSDTWKKTINPRMLSGHLQGRFLSMFSQLITPNSIIEIGTFTGYSALCLAEGLPNNGKLYTIDNNEEHLKIAQHNFSKSEYKKNIFIREGEALEIIPEINENFQLAFIDADKENYCKYYEMLMQKIDVNGYIIADNVLWSGKVLDPKDNETKALDDYNKLTYADHRTENYLLPIRDGLMISKKISD